MIEQVASETDHQWLPQLWSVVEESAEGILFVDAETLAAVHANPAFCQMIGYTLEELRSLELAQLAAAPDHRPWEAELANLIAGQANNSAWTLQFRPRDGQQRRLEATFLYHTGAQPNLLAVVVREARWAAQIEALAASVGGLDAVTGLPNRPVLEGHLELAARRSPSPENQFALLFVDVDHFKQVNDCWGHLAGDQVLRELATRLQSHLRPCDVVARYGGDEYVIIVDGIQGQQQVAQLAERIRQATQLPIRLDSGEVQVSASIGIRLCQGSEAPVKSLLADADEAMYQAKEAGRTGAWAFYSVPTGACSP